MILKVAPIFIALANLETLAIKTWGEAQNPSLPEWSKIGLLNLSSRYAEARDQMLKGE